MRSIRNILVLLAMSVIVTANIFASVTPGASPARAEQQRYRWKVPTIKIAVSSSLIQSSTNIKTDSDVIGAVRRSLDAWQEVAGVELQLITSDKLNVSPAGPAGDKVNLITIAQTPDNVLLFSKSPLTESAKTRVFYNRSGNITEADIVLSPFQQFSTDGTFGTFDLESTLTHEIGHLLGLRHSGVLGSTMSDSSARNGSLGFIDLGSRTLAASDIAAVRDLYGTLDDDVECCAAVIGKLTAAVGRFTSLRVWAEESATGRVMAQVETGTDGAFRIGGLNPGTYNLFWQKRDDPGTSSIGGLGSVVLENGELTSVNERIVLGHSDLALKYVGINSQLTDSSVPVAAGREYTIYVGGKNINANDVRIAFSSPYLKLAAGIPVVQDFGQTVSVFSVNIVVDRDTPPGVYSVFATGPDNAQSSLIGAISVEE
ncbi:MAG: matrixin family metalloprotease [Pyrinomonadaceae bacterium]